MLESFSSDESDPIETKINAINDMHVKSPFERYSVTPHL